MLLITWPSSPHLDLDVDAVNLPLERLHLAHLVPLSLPLGVQLRLLLLQGCTQRSVEGSNRLKSEGMLESACSAARAVKCSLAAFEPSIFVLINWNGTTSHTYQLERDHEPYIHC